MAIRLRKVKNKNATGGFSYIALCAAKNRYEKGDIYLNDSIDYALRMKFLKDYKDERANQGSQPLPLRVG